MTLNTNVRRAAALIYLLTQAACYTARPLDVGIPAPNTRVIAQLTDSGTVAMANALGPGGVEVEGIVESADASGWTLRMLRVDQRGGISTLWNREAVTFPRYTLTRLTEKRIDRKKSWAFAGLLTAAVVIAGRAFGVFTIGSEPVGPPPPPQ